MDNIIFDKITINNFLSMGHEEIDLSDRGFVLVKGKNCESPTQQSNGAGKSTIFDAIFWTLTGSTLRGATDVVNENRKSEGCSCTLEFHTLSKNYKIIRNKGKINNCCFYEDDVLLSDQTKKTQEFIKGAVPSVASSEVLGSIILLGQGLPYKFSSFSPSKRKDLLETMSGSSSEISKVKCKLDIEESNHSIILNSLNQEISTYQGTIIGLDSTINLLNRQIESAMSSEEIEKEMETIQVNIDSIKDQVSQLTEESNNLVQQQNDCTETRKPIEDFLADLRAQQSIAIQTINSIRSGDCPTCGRPFEISEETIKRRDQLIAEKVNRDTQIEQLTTKLQSRIQLENDLNGQLTKVKHKVFEFQNNIQRLEQQKEYLKQKLVDTTEFQTKLQATQAEIDSLNVKINGNKDKILIEQEYLDCIGYLKRQLSKDFKGYMLKEAIDFMSLRAEYYSNYLFTNGKHIEIELSGNNVLIKVGGRLYENLSGGERQRVDLAVQFALRDMLVTTSGFSCNLLVLDEAFDNLDAQGSDALVQLVTSEFSDVSTIYIVTHHSEIAIPYDHQIIVQKNSEGISEIL